jgi:hypothetical protein
MTFSLSIRRLSFPGAFARDRLLLESLDSLSANYIHAKAEATGQTPAQVIGALVRAGTLITRFYPVAVSSPRVDESSCFSCLPPFTSFVSQPGTLAISRPLKNKITTKRTDRRGVTE